MDKSGVEYSLIIRLRIGGILSCAVKSTIKATLVQGLYSIVSEAKLCEHIQYNFLDRWFLDLPPEAEAWDHSTFTKNRQRFAEREAALSMLERVIRGATKWRWGRWGPTRGGYQISQRIRMRIEQVIGWIKTVAGLERTRFVGRWKTQLYAYAAGAAWNFLRLTNLAA